MSQLGDWMLAADGSCRSRSCCDRDSVCKVSVLDVKWGLGCGVAAGHHRVPKKRYLCREGLPVSCSPHSWPPPPPPTPRRFPVLFCQSGQSHPPKRAGCAKAAGSAEEDGKMGSAWEGGAHTVHRAAPSDNLILGTGRGWTAENKERWTEAEDVRGFEVVHQRSVFLCPQ